MTNKSFDVLLQKVIALTNDSSNLSNAITAITEFQTKQGSWYPVHQNIETYLNNLLPDLQTHSNFSEAIADNAQFLNLSDTEAAEISSELNNRGIDNWTNFLNAALNIAHKADSVPNTATQGDGGIEMTSPEDRTAPVLLTEGSLDNRTDVSTTDNLQLTFSENIQLGAGVIELHKTADNSLLESFKNGAGSEGGSLSISKAQLSIDPFADLTPDTHYYLTFSGTAIKDLAGNAFEKIAEPDRLDFTTVKPDTQAPGLLPLDTQATENVINIVFVGFNENVRLAGGDIELHKASDHSLVGTLSNGALSATVYGSEINILFNQNMLPATRYYLTIANNAVEDTAGNAFAGFSDPAVFSFTTAAPDLTAPLLSNITPQNPLSVASDLNLAFNEPVKPGAGTIVLHKASDGSVIETFKNGQGSLGGFTSVSKSSVNINFGPDLSFETQYYLTISADAVTDLAGNAFAGISDPSSISFTSPGPDLQAPTLFNTTVYAPPNGALIPTTVALNPTTVALSFDEEVKLGAGDIVLHKASDGSVVETFTRGAGSADGYITAMHGYGQLILVTYAELSTGADYYLTLDDNAITDTVGNAFAGVSDPAVTQFTQPQPNIPIDDQPLTVNPTPVDNQIGVPVSTDIYLYFNHPVKLGSGAIELHNAGDNSIVESFSNGAGSAGGTVTVSDSFITVNPAADLAPATQYYITVDNGLISDTKGEVYKGFSDADTLNFFTAGVDRLAPQLTGSTPLDNQSITLDSTISLYFNEPVQFGKGAIELHKTSDNSLIESFNRGTGSSGGAATVSKAGVTIDPSAKLAPETQYYLTISNNAITDTSGNAFAGFSDPTQLNFTTIPNDQQGPVLYNPTPPKNLPATGDLILNFNEDIQWGTGALVLHKASDGSVVESFANGIGSMGGSALVVNSTASKSGPAHSVTLNPVADLSPETQYYLTIAGNAISDTAGNAFAGFSDPAAFSFTTAPPGPVLFNISLQNVPLAGDLILNFDQAVRLGVGDIVLHKTADGSVVETFTNGVGSAGGSASASETSVSINPNADLAPLTSYYLTITKGAITDSAGVAFAGLSDPSLFNFTTVPLDTAAPVLFWTAPVDNQTHIVVNTDFLLSFNEAVRLGAGSIELHKTTDNSLVESFIHGVGSAGGSVSTSNNYADTSLIINPASDLLLGTQYYITVSGDAITDLSGNAFSGFSDPYSFNFKTTSDPDTAYTNPDGNIGLPIELVGVSDSVAPVF